MHHPDTSCTAERHGGGPGPLRQPRADQGPCGHGERYTDSILNPNREAIIRKLMLGIVGAAAVAASLLLMRQQKQSQPKEAVAEAERASGAITLDRMRELGL